MNWPTYAQYKESGIDWLGPIPASWRIDRMRYVFTKVQRPYGDNAETVTAFRDGVVTRRSNRRIDGFTEADKYIGYQGIEPGDLAIHAMDGFAGAIGVSDSHGKCSPVVSVCQATRGENSHYFAHILRHVARSGFLTAIAKGVRERSTDFRWADARDLLVPYPPVEAQHQIVDFLDRETAKIDALIAKQEQLIATLREDRAATITQAVTKGLDPNVEMKVSGTEWLGALPQHWLETKLKWVTSLVTSGSRGWAQYYADEGDYFVRIGNLTRGSIGFDDADVQRVCVPPGSEGSRTVTHVGDLLFSITAYLGSVAVVDEDHAGSFVSQHVALVRLAGTRLDPQFVGYFMLSELGQRQLQEQAYGGTKVQLSLDDIRGLELPAPPLMEQAQIVSHLHCYCGRMDALIAKCTRVIETLREYRSALITDAVRGKIDVRGTVAEGVNKLAVYGGVK